MNVRNKMMITGLIGLLSASVLMMGCTAKMTEAEKQEAVGTVEVIKGEGTGIIADIGIIKGAMFKFDSAELNDEGRDTLNAYREKLGPELTDAYKVVIIGHTDSTGDLNHNMGLSLRRAQSVADFVISTGADPDKVSTIGRGPKDPIASNDTREGRMKNRRVDILVIAELRALDQLRFPSAVLFERDKHGLTEAGVKALDKNIETARGMLRSAQFIEIVGHTDDVWDDEHNMELSKKRAEEVRAHLVSKGIDASKMVTTGMGESMPIADNTTRAGRAKNRRVEILVLGRVNP